MQSVTVFLESGEKREYPYGTPVDTIFEKGMSVKDENPIVAALVNSALTSLSYKVEIDAEVKPVRLFSHYGNRVYRRSLSFLLTMASHQLFPDRHLIIGHSLGDGYYYYYEGMAEVSDRDIQALEEKMREISAQGLPIQRRVLSYSETMKYLQETGLSATEKLLHYRNDPKIPVYTCGSYLDLSYEPLLPSTDLLYIFEVKNYAPGFLLRFPQAHSPDRISPFDDNPLLFSIYREYKAWGKILNVNCAGRLNEMVEQREVQHFIQVAEALHEKKISLIADQIQERRNEVRVVLIAGPSSSGKTTFTRRLAIQLRVLGFNPVIIGLDDYFLPRDITPLDEYGKPNFEDLHALNVELLNQHLMQLFDGKEVEIPIFDFKLQRPKDYGTKLQFSSRSILLMEGIHGLNPDLTPNIPEEKKFRIYISALTQLNLDDHNRISTTDNRLIRRIVRDHQFRGTPALGTLNMWSSVRRGENKNIFPFQNRAEAAFNSALDYELAVLKPYVESQLRTVKPHHEAYNEARRLLAFLENFSTVPSHLVPRTSILREFVGGSVFYSQEG
ncbi:MAG TPA: nucleoside kinase [Sediminispirochaeta sp.]|nr:nucleoside kinase [Sediminispirochaeta sp.]